MPQKFLVGDAEEFRPLLTIMRGCGDNDILAEQIELLRFREFRGTVTDKDAPAEPEDKNRHLVDCLSYILLERPRFISPEKRKSTFKAINAATGY